MYDELIIQIRQLQHWFKPNDSECFDPYEILEQAANAIENLDAIAHTYLETIHEIEDKHKWIPVTERLPEEGQYVLMCYCGNVYVYEFRVLSETDDKAEVCWEDDYGYFQSIEDEQFWMPLPELPKEK